MTPKDGGMGVSPLSFFKKNWERLLGSYKDEVLTLIFVSPASMV